MLQLQCRVRRDTFVLDIDVELPTPGVTALFGRSGAGKSTVVALLAGLLRPDEGRIVLNERVLFDSSTNVDPEDRAVGYVFQDARLFPHYSVQGNLTYGQRRRRARPNRISFEQVVDLLGLANLLARRTFRLSGGERQRVALGRALLSQPQLLLLDEPLASLDSERKEELLPYFERLRDELALPIIHVTHAFDEVLRIAQHVVLLQDGRVSASASLQEICRLPELHAITGPEVAGSVLEGVIEHRHTDDASAAVRCGDVQVRVAKLRAEPGARVRLFIAADDVAVSRGRPQDISMRNVLPATVEHVVAENGAALLHLRTGSERLLARITPASVSELKLAPGSDCFALFKAVATHGRRFARVSNLE